ncbi:unnamed protein product [Cyprideis torosa]|uniref:Uncharacterized protein n=1 Tax=Cyprideis torosa TaxID=163714 RepID=A0A7R8WAL1_9CRUS|nr:unnamed protein product [Cyprideis torosa]CAG0891160.1 unnamed protein product [Cyprideis torosa]
MGGDTMRGQSLDPLGVHMGSMRIPAGASPPDVLLPAHLHSIEVLEQGSNRTSATRGIFATYPNENTSTWAGFSDQVLGTFVLTTVVLAASDASKGPLAKGFTPLWVGIAAVVVGLSFGFVGGAGINPARDFAPRVFTAFVGYDDVFSAYNYWFWIPLVAPFLGGILSGFLFPLCFGYDPNSDSSRSDRYDLDRAANYS